MTNVSTGSGVGVVRLPKAAEIVTEDLRRRLAQGEFSDSGVLPAASDLMHDYGLSRPTLREAYRVLEAERLITRDPLVRSRYHITLPSITVGARYAGLLLQTRGARLGDVEATRAIVDWEVGVRAVRQLASGHHGLADLEATVGTLDTFHEQIANVSESRTLVTLSRLVGSAVQMHRPIQLSEIPVACQDPSAHLEVVQAIRDGDADHATLAWRQHLDERRRYIVKSVGDDVLDLFSSDRNETEPSAVLANELRSAIARGELVAGSRLPTENELREQHQVSRVVLRAALRILESEGLLDVRRGATGGVTVMRPDADRVARYIALLLQTQGARVIDFFEARTIIESALAERVASQASRDEIVGALTEALAVEARVLESPADFAHAAIRFHERLARRAESPTLEVAFTLIESVLHQAAEARLSREPRAQRISVAHAEHAELIALIDAGDIRATANLWRAHCSVSSDSLAHGGNQLVDLFAT